MSEGIQDGDQAPEVVLDLLGVEAREVWASKAVSVVPGKEAEHRRKLERWCYIALLIVLLPVTLATAALVFYIACSGQPTEQRLAFGLIGAVLGLLWSNFGKLLDKVGRG